MLSMIFRSKYHTCVAWKSIRIHDTRELIQSRCKGIRQPACRRIIYWHWSCLLERRNAGNTARSCSCCLTACSTRGRLRRRLIATNIDNRRRLHRSWLDHTTLWHRRRVRLKRGCQWSRLCSQIWCGGTRRRWEHPLTHTRLQIQEGLELFS